MKIALVAMIFVACTTPGTMRNGKIEPCGGYHTDSAACGAALFNAPRLAKVQTGMTREEVRALMEHDAERRTLDGGRESWGYINNYDSETMTWITFTDGRVTALTQGPWKG